MYNMKKTGCLLLSLMLLVSGGCLWQPLPSSPEEAAVEVMNTSAAEEIITEAPSTDTEPDRTSADTETVTRETDPVTEAVTEPVEVTPAQVSATIVCAGDNLIHAPIYRSANAVAGGDGYEFSPSYEHLGTLISDADLAILNQETIISDDFEPDTYPSFCTPSEMARDMTELGFDAFSISNNHVLDKGEAGLISTLNFWRENYPDNPVYGAYLNEADMNDIRTMEVNGITFAFLGYTEHTNGRSLPAGSECKVVYMSEEDLIREQVKRAAEISDCVIVSVHFGIEVSNIITGQQKDFSRKLADWGADIIIGTQPHTIQSMEYLDAADGRKAFVFYCLGNLISTMDNPLAMAEMLGRITVTKDTGTGEITLSDANAVPLVDHFTRSYDYIAMYPLDQFTPAMAADHAIAGTTYELMIRLFRENIPEEFMAEEYRELVYGYR